MVHGSARCGLEKPEPTGSNGNDRRLQRVMKTFSQEGEGTRLQVDELLAAMDRSGVERAVLAVKVYYPAPAEAVEALNQRFAERCALAPGRLRWMASLVPPENGASSYWDVMQDCRMLGAIHDLPGLCGVHITPSPWGILPNDRWFYPANARCVDHALPAFAYVDAPGRLWPVHPNDPSHLDEVTLAFPDLAIVAHHIGDPWTETAVRLAARHEHFCICTSACSPKVYPEPLLRFLGSNWHGVRGANKVIFTSDCPLLDLERATRDARALDLALNSSGAFCLPMPTSCCGVDLKRRPTGRAAQQCNASFRSALAA
jgi:predicted TIM-barrel fold metal-dependent hydrolase